GKRLVADIAKAKNELADEVFLAATDDLTTVVVGRVAWAVRADRELVLARPKNIPASYQVLFSAAAVIGNALVTQWWTGAGPCGQATAATTAGKNVGEPSPAGVLVALDDHRVVVLPTEQESVMTILDRATGATVRSFPVDAW